MCSFVYQDQGMQIFRMFIENARQGFMRLSCIFNNCNRRMRLGHNIIVTTVLKATQNIKEPTISDV